MRGISSIPQDLGSPFLGTSTPGIPGGTSNLHYFHSHLAGGLSGTQTPLAAVAGAQLGNNNSHSNNNSNNNSSNGYFQHQQQSRTPEPGGSSPQSASTAGFPEHVPRWPNHSRNPSQGSSSVEGFSHRNSSAGQGAASSLSGLTPMRLSEKALREKSSVSTFGATSSAGTSRPPTRDKNGLAGPSTSAIAQDNHDVVDDENIPSIPKPNKKGQNDNNCDDDDDENDDENDDKPPRFREPRTEDIQAVFRIRYSGDVKLLLTADILLDYPMPSFVGIPLRLSITGLSFDGVGVVAYIRKRVHFCFLSPEDALAAVGADEEDEGEEQNGGGGGGGAGGGGPGHASSSARNKMGGLLQEIRVESEIGQREGGKQSLKNVGKVERFVLEQVRRIFEEEFVYPSFWTFLV
ncbi:hypothetical protein BD289DRAFT_438280 [Coniella lustricola]|uniref:Mitochondrial distribution and morphology protein 12 n=1 Tax=Coniella lustricola TaxID=2025994 RepID=A0A2T3A354_9PEZI|nr:hypothetical protein BD289DRAFT_438280 [Coniella lustricola]